MKKKLIAKVMACGIAVSMLWNPVAVCAEENSEGGEEAEYITGESYVDDFEDQEGRVKGKITYSNEGASFEVTESAAGLANVGDKYEFPWAF